MSETTESSVLPASEHRHPRHVDSSADPLAKTRRGVRRLALVTTATVGAGVALVAAASALEAAGRSPTAAAWAGGIGLLLLLFGVVLAVNAVWAGLQWRHVQRLARRDGYLPITPEEAELLYGAERALLREFPDAEEAGARLSRLLPAIVEEACLDVPADLATLRRRAEQAQSAAHARGVPGQGWRRHAETGGTTEVPCDGCVRRWYVAPRDGFRYPAPVLITIDLEPLGVTTTRAHVRAAATRAARRQHRLLQQVVDGLTRDQPGP